MVSCSTACAPVLESVVSGLQMWSHATRCHVTMICSLSAKRSKDPSTQVGAVIVDDAQRIIGIGYNGTSTICDDGAREGMKV